MPQALQLAPLPFDAGVGQLVAFIGRQPLGMGALIGVGRVRRPQPREPMDGLGVNLRRGFPLHGSGPTAAVMAANARLMWYSTDFGDKPNCRAIST